MTQKNQTTPSAPSSVAQEIMTCLEERYGIQLGSILQDTKKSTKERRNEAASILIPAIWARIDKEHEQKGTKIALTEADKQFEKELKNNSVDVMPIYALAQAEVEKVKSKNGEELVQHLERDAARFEELANAADDLSYATTLFIGAMGGVGISMVTGALAAIKGGATLTAALLTGVRSVGFKTAVGAAALILIGLLLWILNQLERSIMGIAVNETNEPMIVKDWQNGISGGSNSDIWMEHGAMIAFTMEDSINNGTDGEEEVFLPPVIDFGEEEGLYCMCGYMCADEDVLLAGECAYAMRITAHETNKAIHLLATSPTFGASGVVVDLNTPSGADLEQFFKDNVGRKAFESREESDGFGVYMKMDSETPGHRAVVASIYPSA